jgi:hypothetical protein
MSVATYQNVQPVRISPRIYKQKHLQFVNCTNTCKTLICAIDSISNVKTRVNKIIEVYQFLLSKFNIMCQFTIPRSLSTFIRKVYTNVHSLQKECATKYSDKRISKLQFSQFSQIVTRIDRFVYTYIVYKLALLRIRLPNGVVNLIADFYLSAKN